MENTYIEIFKDRKDLICDNCAVLIDQYSIKKNSTNNELFLQVKFRNISLKRIIYLSFSFKTYDQQDKLIDDVKNVEIKDFIAESNEGFGDKNLVRITNSAISRIKFYITKVNFIDGSKYTNNKISFLAPKEKRLESLIKDENIISEYKLKLGKEAIDIFDQYDGFYRCSCGSLNCSENEICRRCHIDTLIQNEANKKLKTLLSKKKINVDVSFNKTNENKNSNVQLFKKRNNNAENSDLITNKKIDKNNINKQNIINKIYSENECKDKKQSKKKISLVTIIVISVFVSFILIASLTFFIKPDLFKYLKYVNEKDLRLRYQHLSSIDVFDSQQLAKESCNEYLNQLMQNDNYEELIKIFNEDYKYLGISDLANISEPYYQSFYTNIYLQYAIQNKDINAYKTAYSAIHYYENDFTNKVGDLIIDYLVENYDGTSTDGLDFFITLFRKDYILNDKKANIKLIHKLLLAEYQPNNKYINSNIRLDYFGYDDINDYYDDLKLFYDSSYYNNKMYKKMKNYK